MTSNEGVGRMYSLAKLFTLFGSLFGIVLWFSLVLVTRRGAVGELVVWVTVPVIIGAVLAIIAWIVDGFVLGAGGSREQSSSQSP
jgi:hypothetical protein